MKSVLNSIYEFFVLMGQAKAASVLARAGYYEEAKEMMAGK